MKRSIYLGSFVQPTLLQPAGLDAVDPERHLLCCFGTRFAQAADGLREQTPGPPENV